MSKKGFKLDKKAVGDWLKSEEMEAVIVEAANVVLDRAKAADEGYDGEIYRSKQRVGVRIVPITASAYKDNNENNTLLKCIGE